MFSAGIGFESKSILTGVVIGIIVGGLIGYASAPVPDYTPYEDQIAELESQITSLQDEIVQLQSQVSSLQNQLDSKDENMILLKTQVSSLQNQLDIKNGTMILLKTQLSSQKVLIDELIDQIEILIHICNYTSGTWNEIGVWTGSASTTTETFHVPSSQIRIKWSLDVNSLSNFTISMYEEDNDQLVLRWSNLQNEPEGMTYGDIRPGSYYLGFSVDECEYNVTVEVLIEVPSTWTYLEENISPRKPEFKVGEIIAFKMECNHPYNNSYFEIWDPNGSLIWRSDYLTEWIKIDGYWGVPYYKQLSNGEPMSLENNCTLGTWSWVWNSETKLVSGTFEVIQ
jgi:regulator of replication initiation timing